MRWADPWEAGLRLEGMEHVVFRWGGGEGGGGGGEGGRGGGGGGGGGGKGHL